MSLTINYVVVHKLNKVQKNKVTTSRESEELLDASSEVVVQMVKEINAVYGRKQNYVQYGTFIDTAFNSPSIFKAYFEIDGEKPTEFMELTKELLKNFVSAASFKNMATGGYIVFSDFVSAGVNQFLIAMVKDKSGISFDENLKPKSIERIDLEKLHQAFRLNFKSYSDFNDAEAEEKEKFNYLSFISKTNQATDYFVDALSSQVGNSSSKATASLIDAVFDYAKEKYKEGYFKSPARDVKEDLCKLMEDTGDGKIISLDNIKVFLSGYVDPASPEAEKSEEIIEDFISSLNSEKYVIPYEFAISLKEVKKKGRVLIKSSNWDIKFDRNLLGDNETDIIYYDKANHKLTFDVSEDENIVSRLEDEINELKIISENNSEESE